MCEETLFHIGEQDNFLTSRSLPSRDSDRESINNQINITCFSDYNGSQEKGRDRRLPGKKASVREPGSTSLRRRSWPSDTG